MDIKKELVFGIILLFIMSSGIPSIVGNSRKTNDRLSEFLSLPQELWNSTFGGMQYDNCRSTQQTVDGGYIITGETHSFGDLNGDVWLIKTDIDGHEQWMKTFGGTGWDGAYSVQQTSDLGYIISGFTYSYGAGDEDVWLIKTDVNGTELWNKTFGGPEADWGNYVQQTNDGGYIITGGNDWYNYIWLIKTDENGEKQWDKTFNGSEGMFVQQTTDNGYILVGYGNYLIKTDANGNEQWTRTFSRVDYARGYCVRQTTDNGFIICGWVYSNANDVLLIKTDTNGYEQWNITYGGVGEDRGCSVQQTNDGGYMIAGYTTSYGAGSYDAWLIRTDANGNEQWNMTLGGVDWDLSCYIQKTTDGGYIIGGETVSYGVGGIDAWLIKIESENQPPETPTINGPSWGITNVEYSFSINVTDPDGDALYCIWDWGDGNITDWLGPYDSGTTVNASHTWNESGTYEIKAKLKNSYGAESNWSDSYVFNVNELKKAFIFGRFSNPSSKGEFMTVHAINLRMMAINKPFRFLHYFTGENIIFSEGDMKALITPRFIIGLVNVVA